MVESLGKIGKVSQPQETFAPDKNSIALIDEMLDQNKQNYKNNDSNNCSFDDAEIESERQMVQDNIEGCDSEPDKLAKQLRNKEILEERVRALARKQWLMNNPIPQPVPELISLEEEIQKLLEEEEIKSISELYEEIEAVNETIKNSKKPKELLKAQNQLGQYNIILNKHAQLVQPQIQQILDELELQIIDEAILEQQEQQEKLKSLGQTKVKQRQECQKIIDLVDEILKISGRSKSQKQNSGFGKINPDQQIPVDGKINPDQPISGGGIIGKIEMPPIKIQEEPESLFQREKEDAENQAGFIKSAPDSFEKSVITVTHILYQMLDTKMKPAPLDKFLDVPTSSYNSLIQTHLTNIKETYIGEVRKNNQIINKVNQLVDPNGNDQQQYHKILNILKEIQPLTSRFNFQEFFSYIEKANEVSKTINNTDIVLLLGTTGAGKSTTIHYLCGSEMYQTENNGLKHIGFGNVTNQDLLKVKVSPYARSETRYIKPIKIEQSNNESITLVDSPGLFDLKNAEVDVSNQISIVNALSCVRSVKPFIVFGYKKLGARGENFKEILTFYSQMILNSDYLESFNFFFSHVDMNISIKNLTARIKDILEQLNDKEKQNQRLVEFLKVIIEKAENEEIYIIDPLNRDKVSEILRSISRNRKKITSPSSVFQKAISEESKSKIIEQFDLHSKRIFSQFKKGCVEKVGHLLSELMKFCEIMDSNQDYKLKLNVILKKLSSKLNDKYDEVSATFKKQFQTGNKIREQDVGLFQSNLLYMCTLEKVRKDYLCQIDGNPIQTHSHQDLEIEVVKIIKDAYQQINQPKPAKLDSQNLHDYLQKLEILKASKIEIFAQLRKDVFDKLAITLKEKPKKAEKLLEDVMDNFDKESMNYSTSITKSNQLEKASPNKIEEDKHNEHQEEKMPSQQIDEFSILVGELERAEHISKDELKALIKAQKQLIEKNLQKKFEQINSKLFDESQNNTVNTTNLSSISDLELNSLIGYQMSNQRIQRISKYYQLLNCFIKSMNTFNLSQGQIDYIEGKQSKINDQMISWSTVQEEKLKRKVSQEKRYSEIKTIYDELMLAQNLPALQGQTVRQNRIKMHLTKLVQDKVEEAKKHMTQIANIVNLEQLEEGKSKDNQQISMYTLVSLKDAISTIKDLYWTIQNGNEDFYEDLKQDLKGYLNKLVILIEQSVRIQREKKSSISEIGETEQAFKQISEIQNIAVKIDIQLPNINVDEFIPEIEQNLNGAENFLIKKRILPVIPVIAVEDSKNDEKNFDELLKKSECEKFSKYYTYLNVLEKRKFMIQKIDDISKKSYTARIKHLNDSFNDFIQSQMSKITEIFKTQLTEMNKYIKKIEGLPLNDEGLYESKENQDAAQFLTDYLINPVECIVSIFKMIKELKSKYEFIWKKINPHDDEEELKAPILRFYNDTNRTIAIAYNNQVKVTNYLKIINQLIPLDQYIHDQNESNSTNIIQSQYDAHFKNLMHFQLNVVKSVQDFITNQNYEEIKETLATLQKMDSIDQQINFKKIKSLLNQRCNTLCYSINRESKVLVRGSQIDPLIIEKINKESSELKDLCKIIGERFLDKNTFEKAKQVLEHVNAKMDLDFKQLSTLINSQIQNQRYKEANDYIDNYFESAKNLDFNSLIGENNLEGHQNHLSQIEGLRKFLENSIKSKSQEFEDLKIKSDQNNNDDSFLEKMIKNSPKEIIENLESNQKDSIFKNAARQINQSIEEVFSERIRNLSLTGDQVQQKIDNYLRFCAKLPKDLNKRFKADLIKIQKTFEELQAKESKQIIDTIELWKKENKNFHIIFDELATTQYTLNNQCKTEVNKQYFSESEKILNLIKENGLTADLYDKIHQIWLYQSSDSIKRYLDSKSNTEYDKLVRIIQNIYKQIEKRISALLSNKENSTDFQIRIDDKEYTFNISQISWFDELFENQICKGFVKENFQFSEDYLFGLIEQGGNQISSLYKNFSTFINQNDPTVLSEIFKIIELMRSITPAQELLLNLSSRDTRKFYEEFMNLSKNANKKQFCTQFAEKYNKIANQIIKAQFINPQTSKIDEERKQYYDQLDKCLIFVQKSQQVREDLLQVDIDTSNVLNACFENFQKNYEQIEEKAKELTKNLQGLDQKKIQELNIKLENLKMVQEQFKSIVPNRFEQLKSKAINSIKQQVDDIKVQLQNQNFQSKAITEQLIISQNIAQNVKQLQQAAQESIQEILDSLQQNCQDQANISEVALILKKSPVGSLIVEQQPIFICDSRTFWAKKIEHQDIGYVLDNILTNDKTKLTAKEKNDLRIKYDQFTKSYKELVEQNIAPYEDIPKNKELIRINLLQLTQETKKDSQKDKFNQRQKDQIYLILAHLFALWTLQDFYKNKLKVSDSQDASTLQYLLKPHPAQVVSILRILGHGFEKVVQQDEKQLNSIKNQQIQNFLNKNDLLFDNLVQIKTGEGKSITLAIVIAVFAMWDFEVSCACYSEYLSNRDFDQFKHLFQFLNINDKIFYGTFNKICENYINKDGNIRDIVLNTIQKDSQKEIIEKHKFKRRVILIDEVDVFFSKEFYNQLYVPVAEIKNQQVSNLLDYMWDNRQNPTFSFRQFKRTPEYLECAALFKPEFVGILDEACKKMFLGAQKYLDHQYIVQNEMIGYQEMDQISFTKSYGYNTIFAHYHHAETGEVSQQNLQKCKGIEIYCGKFSYAEIPLYSMFVLGVTGTLDSLTETENLIIKDFFQIKNFTFSPSVYGKNKLQWANLNPNKRLLIYNETEYYNELTNEIKSKIKGDNNCQRAVLVFFKTIQLLMKFRESQQYQELGCDKQELTELCDAQEKEGFIIKATYQNTLTLATRSYGRGTDFICRDEVVEKNEGVHVILTFVPEMHSEFVQIQGRTARQGNNGSFQMILLDSYLSEVDVDAGSEEFIKQYDNKLEYIFQKRDQKMMKEQQSNKEAVKEIKQKHLEALKIKDLLLKNDSSNYAEISKYLVSINEGVIIEEDDNPVKTMILMDATGSMSSFLTEAKNSVYQMYERTAEILEQNDLGSHLNWLQYACYRNYSSGANLILQHSPWESKPEQLKQFMDKIDVSGGQGNEAIEIGFQHAVREAQNDAKIPLRQIYLIGDMPPNTKSEVDSRRVSQKWLGTRFEEPAYWETEIDKLKENNIVVNTFYVSYWAKESFEDIAKRTGGICAYLDVNKPNSQAILLDLFVPNILKMIGEATGDTKLGPKMVDDYMKCYKS